MGRTWCRTDPTFKVNGKPLQLSILAATPELKADHTKITLRADADTEVDLPHGQAHRKIFGGSFTVAVNKQIDGALPTIEVMVAVAEGGTGAELVITAHDQSGVFGHMIGIGYTDEDVLLEPIGD